MTQIGGVRPRSCAIPRLVTIVAHTCVPGAEQATLKRQHSRLLVSPGMERCRSFAGRGSTARALGWNTNCGPVTLRHSNSIGLSELFPARNCWSSVRIGSMAARFVESLSSPSNWRVFGSFWERPRYLSELWIRVSTPPSIPLAAFAKWRRLQSGLP